MIKLKNSRCFSSAMNLKVLSLAALTGLAFTVPAYAEDAEAPVLLGSPEVNTLLTQKPITSATLDYLRANGVLIPQKDADPIEAPESAYRIVEGTADNHTFEYKTVDEEGNVTTTYYTVELKNTELGSFGTSKNLTWTELTEQPAEDAKNTITVKLPNNVTKYYQYSYTKPEGYEEVNERLENPTGDIKDTVFKDITSTSDGGAIYNYAYSGNAKIGNITGDFIGNSANKGDGGAISNYAYSGSVTIDNITGDFIGNSATGATYSNGGAISNYADSGNAKIGNITGDFIGNNAVSDGGAIYNNARSYSSYVTIGDITGNFIGNSAGSSGGAIYNNARSYSSYVTIGDITGNFIGNSAGSNGGAISNDNATISNITGDFIGNNAGSYGGAIYNYQGTISNITGDFIGNNAGSYGGAIFNGAYSGTAIIGNITANFIGNSGKYGGAIYNTGTVSGAITGDFIGNSANNSGGAIYNAGTVSDITGDFIGNSDTGTSSINGGGAIYNTGTVSGAITGDFIGNSAGSEGGAISNVYMKTIKNITGDFIGNSAGSEGGAISNQGTISHITGNFIGNSAGSKGGAIYTNKDLNIVADSKNIEFTDNYVQVGDGEKQNEAIYVDSTSATLTLKATNNGQITMNDYVNGSYGYKVKLESDSTGTINLYNDLKNAAVTTENVTVNMADGKTHEYNVQSWTSDNNTIYNLDIDFTNKTADTIKTTFASSGTVTIGQLKILGDFPVDPNETYKVQILKTQNSNLKLAITDEVANQLSSNEYKVGISGVEIAEEINATTNWNDIYKVFEQQTDLYGTLGLATTYTTNDSIGISITRTEEGALVEKGTLDVLTSLNALNTTEVKNFNFDSAENVYIVAKDNPEILGLGKTKGAQLNINGVTDEAGNHSTIDLNNRSGFELANKTLLNIKDVTITGGNGEDGSAINISNSNAAVNLTNVNFVKNTSSYDAGAIDNGGIIENIIGNFIGNSATRNGGAIYNKATIDSITGNFTGNSAKYGGAIANSGTISNITGDFIGNSAGTNGSAIVNAGTINNITANFIGNKAGGKGGAIWTSKDLTFTADATESVFKDNYTQVGEEKDDNAIYVNTATAKLTFNALNSGKFEMYDNIRGAEGYSVNITGDGTGSFGMYNDMYGANLSMGAINLNTVNGVAHTYNLNSLTLTGDVNATVDVDLANKAMDRFSAASYGQHDGTLTVVGMNLLSDAAEDTTNILFADKELKDNVATSIKEVAYSPIYKYDVSYDNTEDGGYFVFNRGAGSGGNSSDGYNPAVLSAPVSNIAAAQATVNETFKYVFEQADSFTQMPAMERQALLQANRYALSTDYNENLGALNQVANNKAGWFRAYSTIENMDLRNGPKVDAITYGSLVGFDTDFHSHKDGWYSVGTGYVGYNGNLLSYNNVDTTMNGGLLGYTHTMYKNNFWSALTLTAGASVGESRTMYGKEDFTSLMAGLGTKTGYNFEFKEGKYIIQPIMFMSYTFANTFDYTNAAGVKIKPSPAHSIQLNPSVRFISNTKNGWQPYASIGMVWNVMNQNKVMANNVRLPEASMKPYVEYGLGVQRNWKDKFTAFGQAMVRNGGRNGISLTAGFRWTIGNTPTEKVEAPATDRKVLKETKPKVVINE